MKGLTGEQRARLAEILTDFELYAQKYLRIVPKIGGAPVPLVFNDAQRFLHHKLQEQMASTQRIRALVLKGRQQGVSTYYEGRQFWRVATTHGIKSYVLAHEQAASDNLFRMVDRYYANLPAQVKPELDASNAKELAFRRLLSRIEVATAGSKDTGRSGTAQLLHGCLAAGTPVVDGVTGRLRPIESFEPGDQVRTHTGARAPVSFKSTQEKACIKIVMRGLRDFPLICSREHRFWTLRGWVKGGELLAGDRIGYPVAELGETPMSLPFAVPLAERVQGGGAEHRPPHSVQADEALGLLIGLYLAEGCIKKQWKTGAPSSVTFAMHECEVDRNMAWVNALAALCASISVNLRETSKTVTIEAYGKALATRMLEWCGEKDSKRLPSWWREAPREFVLGMARGYLCGDGHFSPERDRRISATSIRSAITVGMRDAIAALGFGWAGIEYKAAGIRHRRNEKEAWLLRLCGAGVEGLSALCGKPTVPRKRADRLQAGATVKDGYAWVPIVGIEDAGARQVYEFEIGHADHSYCILHGATHNSEVAFWPNAKTHLAGIGQTVADAPGTEILLESTANGTANEFHEMWQLAVSGRSEFMPVFIPWFWQREYRKTPPADFELTDEDQEYMEAYGLDLEQMAWRRSKTDTDFRGDRSLFDQEYPASPEVAFASSSPRALIPAALVMSARKARDVEPLGRKIMGVDPAEYGDDETSCMIRQGRVARKVGGWQGLGPMETVAKVSVIADKEKPDVICIDATNSAGITDRLAELGYPVMRVHFGEAARQADQYVICRDEMWGEMAEWLRDKPASIDDDNSLAAQLTSVQRSYDSKRRLKLEPKEKMKDRGLRSPDDADALALTFYQGAVMGGSQAQAWGARPRIRDWRAR